MKLSAIIKRFFRRRDYYLPSEFFWMDRKAAKENMPNTFKRTFMLVLFYCVATTRCAIYLLTIPIRIINEWCESWCY